MHLGMESVAASLSSKQVPTSKWLHIIMNHFLLVSSFENEDLRYKSEYANRVFVVLGLVTLVAM